MEMNSISYIAFKIYKKNIEYVFSKSNDTVRNKNGNFFLLNPVMKNNSLLVSALRFQATSPQFDSKLRTEQFSLKF